MKVSALLIVAFCASVQQTLAQTNSIRFANFYGDHMVLQRAPKSAIVWGYTPLKCEDVTVTLDSTPVKAKVSLEQTQCKWVAVLPATAAGGPHTITASSSSHGKATISDVLFGDVWVCGGQSNMVFSMPQVYNATEEMQKASNYPNLRLFTVQRVLSTTPLDEPPQILQNWSVASPEALNGGTFGYFSAACWFFGTNIYDKYKVPLGLFSSNWGGTVVEAWSSPDALKKCSSVTSTENVQSGPNDPSVLWNSMMHPLLTMTIYGAIWYQGESNAGDPPKYNCTFPAMIADWREKWQETTGQTDPMFPFGFVQLAAYGVNNSTDAIAFPGIRWSQTASYGYVPNSALKNVFMAVAIDLGDPTSPYGNIHPRDKQDVGLRLSLGGRAVAYGDSSVYYTGPIADKATVQTNAGVISVTITFKDLSPSTQSLEKLRTPYGFEVGCVNGNTTTYVAGTAKGVQGANVMVDFPMCPSGSTASMIRYAWRADPCVFKTCAVYSGGLPSPPFMMNLT